MLKRQGISLGRILGIPIGLDYSWFLIFALITWTLAASYYPGEFNNWPVAEYWLVAAATAIMLFVSVALGDSDALQDSGAPHHPLYFRWRGPNWR